MKSTQNIGILPGQTKSDELDDDELDEFYCNIIFLLFCGFRFFYLVFCLFVNLKW